MKKNNIISEESFNKELNDDCIGLKLELSKEPKYPGVEGKPFKLYFENPYHFSKEDVITGPNGQDYIIVRVYKYNWFRKFLAFIGIPFQLRNAVKVKPID